jgi:hypothetical protein
MNEHRISLLRAFAGFATGTAFVLAIYSWLLWPAWDAVLLVGGATAVAIIAPAGFPAFFFLRKRGMLSVYAAALLGGILCLLPALLLAFFNLFNAPEVYRAQPETGPLFLLQYFVLPGVIGGVIGWLAAAGFRLRAS